MKQIICKDVEGMEYEVEPDRLTFRPSVYGLMIKNDKILLLRQYGDGYDFIGGGIEIEETVQEALKREFWEESGLKIRVGELVACENSFFRFRNSDRYTNSIFLYYLCQQVGGKLTKKNFDDWEKENADLAEWVDIKDVDKIKFYNSVDVDSVKIIKKALEIIKKR